MIADADARHARASRGKRSRTSSHGCRASSTSAAAPASLPANIQSTRENLAATCSSSRSRCCASRRSRRPSSTTLKDQIAREHRSRAQRAASRSCRARTRGTGRATTRPTTCATSRRSTKRSRSSTARPRPKLRELPLGTSSAPRTPRSSSSATSIRTRSASCIAERLDDWRSPKPFSDVLTRYANLATDPTTEVFDTPDKENAFFLAGMPIEMRDSHADYPGARARQLHPGLGRRLAPVRPHPRPRRLELRRRLGFQRVTAQRRRHVHGQCHLGAAERRESRSVVPRRARDGAARRLHRGRARGREGRAGRRRVRSRARKTAAWPARSASGTHVGRTMAWDAEFEARCRR